MGLTAPKLARYVQYLAKLTDDQLLEELYNAEQWMAVTEGFIFQDGEKTEDAKQKEDEYRLAVEEWKRRQIP